MAPSRMREGAIGVLLPFVDAHNQARGIVVRALHVDCVSIADSACEQQPGQLVADLALHDSA